MKKSKLVLKLQDLRRDQADPDMKAGFAWIIEFSRLPRFRKKRRKGVSRFKQNHMNNRRNFLAKRFARKHWNVSSWK